MKKIRTIFYFFMTFLSLIPLQIASASPWSMLEDAGNSAQYNTTVGIEDYYTLVGRFISFFLSIIGIIFVCLFVYAGYTWLMARDNAQSVDKAKALMQNSVIGLLITLSAYSIAWFVLIYLSKDLIY